VPALCLLITQPRGWIRKGLHACRLHSCGSGTSGHCWSNAVCPLIVRMSWGQMRHAGDAAVDVQNMSMSVRCPYGHSQGWFGQVGHLWSLPPCKRSQGQKLGPADARSTTLRAGSPPCSQLACESTSHTLVAPSVMRSVLPPRTHPTASTDFPTKADTTWELPSARE